MIANIEVPEKQQLPVSGSTLQETMSASMMVRPPVPASSHPVPPRPNKPPPPPPPKAPPPPPPTAAKISPPRPPPPKSEPTAVNNNKRVATLPLPPPLPAHKRQRRGSLSIEAPKVLRDVNVFLKKHQVGQGTYGSVFVGADRVTGEVVALKRINTEQEENGFPITAIREVKILKALHHVNIVDLKEIVTSKGALVVLRCGVVDVGGI